MYSHIIFTQYFLINKNIISKQTNEDYLYLSQYLEKLHSVDGYYFDPILIYM